jgi:glycosyltransferase involved in cell wall biosynthesis
MSKRILIWNQHWWILGGGERYSATLANVLSKAGNYVVIAGCNDDPRAEIKSRLGIDMDNVGFVSESNSRKLTLMLNGYDIFINGTHRSGFVPPQDILSILICFFPQTLKSRSRWVHKSTARLFDLKHVRKYPQTKSDWLGEDATLLLGEGDLSVEVLSGSLIVSGQQQIKVMAGEQRALKPYFWQRLLPDQNQRTVYRVSGIDRVSFGTLIEDRFNRPLRSVHNYDVVWSISDFTQDWVARKWLLESELLYPPVGYVDSRDSSLPEVPREPYRIISVGRFFPPTKGHCKNQHLMVEAFRKLTANSSFPWKLVLVGSVSIKDKPYLEDVRRRARGLDIEILNNIPGEQLEAEYVRSTFYWHATGLGRSEPEDQEHFGISLVEAMARGLVPIVYDSAGPRRILNKWPQLRFKNTKELVSCQERLPNQNLDDLRNDIRNESLLYGESQFESSALRLLDKLIEK